MGKKLEGTDAEKLAQLWTNVEALHLKLRRTREQLKASLESNKKLKKRIRDLEHYISDFRNI